MADNPCAVCFNPIDLKRPVVLTPCGHYFHGKTCLSPWLKVNRSCPVCRSPVNELLEEFHTPEWVAYRNAMRILREVNLTCDPDADEAAKVAFTARWAVAHNAALAAAIALW